MVTPLSLSDSIHFLTQAVLLLTAVLTLVAYLRGRGRERALIAAMFGSLGITTLVAWGTGLTGFKPFWLTSFSVMAILVHPLLMVLVVHHSRRVPSWIMVAAGAGWVISTAAYILVARPNQAQLPASATLVIVTYFGVVELYAAYALVSGVIRSRGVAQKRLAFAAIGAGLLGVVILLAGLNLLLPESWRIPTFATGLLSFTAVFGFYLGFSPPAWLRRLWLQADIARFTTEQAGPRSVTERASLASDLLADAALSLAGGHEAWVGLAPPPYWRLHGRARTGAPVDFEFPGADSGQLATWLEEGGRGHLVSAAQVRPEAAKRLLPSNRGSILVVPMRSGSRGWGLVLVALDRPSLFLDETIQTLEVLASQACVAYEAEAAEREIIATNKELDAFAYSISHDLRAPLRSMDGFSRILLSEYAEKLPPEARHYADMIVESAREMGQMVDDLLRFSRLGKQELNLADVDTRELADQVVKQLHPEGERQIQFHVGDLPSCRADSGLLKQVFVNLVSNAVKYTRKTPQAEIEVGWTKAHGGAYFVKDNGVGFDMAHAHNLFGVFQRLHRAEEYEGTGVGLALAQRIVNRHGGRMWALAEPEKGATFYFDLKGGQK